MAKVMWFLSCVVLLVAVTSFAGANPVGNNCDKECGPAGYRHGNSEHCQCECCPMYRCGLCAHGYKIINGCYTCQCKPGPDSKCEDVYCALMWCPYGYKPGSNGCDSCECSPRPYDPIMTLPLDLELIYIQQDEDEDEEPNALVFHPKDPKQCNWAFLCKAGCPYGYETNQFGCQDGCKCKDGCQDHCCEPGYHCELQAVTCVTVPCLDQPQCLPNQPTK